MARGARPNISHSRRVHSKGLEDIYAESQINLYSLPTVWLPVRCVLSRLSMVGPSMDHHFGTLLRFFAGSVRDLLPIIVVVAVFQLLVIQQPFPDLQQTLVGLVFVVIGLTLFVQGLEIGFFPLGESLAQAFARKGNLTALLAFSFCLGFGTTVAEPALIAIAAEAGEIASEAGVITKSEQAIASYATTIRMTVAVSVGTSLVVGVFRIIKGWPIHYFIIGGYGIVIAITPLAPQEIVGIAYDAGGVTTSTITVPLVTALGVGLASMIRGRDPMVDGFGLIAFASLVPVIFVLLLGVVL